MKTSRREFFKISSLGIAASFLLAHLPEESMAAGMIPKSHLPFGFQVWTIREKLVKDFPGTLKEMAKMGYSQVEMCSPLGYSGAGFSPLNQMKGTEMAKIIGDCGLKCISSHFNMGELKNSLDNRIEWAQGLGMKQMVLASMGLPQNATIDDYRKAADELNRIGEKTKKAGIQMVYHNHHMEFEKRGDKLIYEALMEQFNPDFVKMQFQVAVISIGYKAAEYFRKYPGRFISAHLADWSSPQNKQVPVGQGDVDWKDFFKAAKTGGVKNYFVEMDPATFAPSAEFLKKI
jgi:sugar phosphate isomerase/epimerase